MYWDGHGWAAPQGPPAATATATKEDLSTEKTVAILAVVAVSTSSASSSSRTSTASAAPAATPTARPTSTAAPAGSAVRDGKFEFQVLGVERSTSKEGIFNPEQAKGEFFTVLLRITNVGDDARSFSASSQHLIINGNEYDVPARSATNTGWRTLTPASVLTGKWRSTFHQVRRPRLSSATTRCSNPLRAQLTASCWSTTRSSLRSVNPHRWIFTSAFPSHTSDAVPQNRDGTLQRALVADFIGADAQRFDLD
jgi:Domain of unknown function (DUF4352)